MDSKFKLGTVSHTPGVLRYFGLRIVQHDDMRINVEGDDKLSAIGIFPIETFPITCFRRRQGIEPLNCLEISTFRLMNSLVGWLGVNTSPLCAHLNSCMQQLAPSDTIKTLI